MVREVDAAEGRLLIVGLVTVGMATELEEVDEADPRKGIGSVKNRCTLVYHGELDAYIRWEKRVQAIELRLYMTDLCRTDPRAEGTTTFRPKVRLCLRKLVLAP